jgi:hypothetical protein
VVAQSEKQEKKMFANTKKILTIAVAAAAISVASLAVTGDAFAKGGGGGGGGMGGHGHGFGWGHRWGGGVVVIDSGCWRWVPGYGRVYVCG